MIVCPVCEHAQAETQGAECEVCGKKLLFGAAGIPSVPAVDGLEPTRHADVDAAAERLGELEPTAHAPGTIVALDAPVEIEATRTAPVEVEVDETPDVERTGDDIPVDAPTEVPLFVTCRYCRTEAMPGERVCGRCGMRLPEFGARAWSAEPPARICGCGATVRGSLCPACGARR